jgi:hypothetical protein
MLKTNIGEPFEPLMENRYLIEFSGVDIPSYLFQDYKLYNDGNDFIFETSFYETVHYSFNPKDIFNVESITIKYLDPTGVVVNGLFFKIKGSNFERKQSYKNHELQRNMIKINVDVDSMHLIYKLKTER